MIRDDLDKALRGLGLGNLAVTLADQEAGPRLEIKLSPDGAGILRDHLAPVAALRLFRGAVLWHTEQENLVIVHKVLSPIRLAVRSRDFLGGVPYVVHVSRVRLPALAELETP
jgi:hypothetical protein